jgi:hypothetical protein
MDERGEPHPLVPTHSPLLDHQWLVLLDKSNQTQLLPDLALLIVQVHIDFDVVQS